MWYPKASILGVVVLVAAAGCMQPVDPNHRVNRLPAKRRALDVLSAAVTYRANPVVRVEAIEALEYSNCPEALPRIRAALSDDHPGVRFAACVALGRLGDTAVEDRLRKRTQDEDPGVQAAALFGLHRLGHTERTGLLATSLLASEEVTVRRNAALLLGMLGESSAVRVLARAMKDTDAGVRHHALEAMARLGNREAKQELAFMTNSGVGSEEVFAINALSATGDRTYTDTFRYKYGTAAHLETRLAAAAALGRHGVDEGFDVARRALRVNRPVHKDPKDPPAGQILRIKQLAAAALGAIGRLDALPALEDMMENAKDPRVQASGARAILEILAADRAGALPFGQAGRERGE